MLRIPFGKWVFCLGFERKMFKWVKFPLTGLYSYLPGVPWTDVAATDLKDIDDGRSA